MNLHSLADNFEISRPAISQHIKILTECGVVVIKQEGRQRFCEAKLDALSEVSTWVDQYKQFWNDKLDSLGSYLDKIQTTNQSNNDQLNDK